MTPQWTVKNFLPDFEKKWEDEVLQYYDRDFGFAPGNESLPDRFYTKHFPEALSELLEAQRSECANLYYKDTDAEYVSLWTMEVISNAPIPEPKNRKQYE